LLGLRSVVEDVDGTPGGGVRRARRLGVWVARLALMVGMVAAATLVALFSAVTYLELTEGGAQSPISILTGVLIPVCGLLAAGCWWLFAESFMGADEPDPDVRRRTRS
jgi:hypothetical protein